MSLWLHSSTPRLASAGYFFGLLLQLSSKRHCRWHPRPIHPNTSQRKLHHATSARAMEVELTAPNGKKWSQPLGLFINNEFVKSSNGETLTSINPT